MPDRRTLSEYQRIEAKGQTPTTETLKRIATTCRGWLSRSPK